MAQIEYRSCESQRIGGWSFRIKEGTGRAAAWLGRTRAEGRGLSASQTFRFEKLDVWRESIGYANLIYKMTKSFPTEERFGLTSQLRRSVVSISANIAEGTSRTTDRDFARFVEIAYGSLMETVSEATIAQHQSLISPEQISELRQQADKLARMLSGLRASLLSEKPSALSSQPSTSS